MANMGNLTDDIRHETQRGVILMILIRRNLDWVPFGELKQQLLRGQGYPLTDDELRFQLLYLADAGRGYIELKPLRAGYTQDKQDLETLQVRATAKAVDLLDRRIAADQGVAF
jgi:hypothetical protein